MNPLEISLSLSGGGIRAAAHIGAIKFLEEQNVKITAVSGSSAGAIVGLCLANGLKSDEMLRFLKDLEAKELFVLNYKKGGFFSMRKLEVKLKEFIKVRDFSELKIPFWVCVTNINSGEHEYINHGNPVDYVIASSTITPLFEAKKIGAECYIDGGFSDNLPVRPLKHYPQKILAININPIVGSTPDSFKSLLIRSILIVIRSNSIPSKRLADAYLEIEGVAKMNIFNFKEIDNAYQAGYYEMKEKWSELKKNL